MSQGQTDLELLHAYHRERDCAARDELIERYLPLVRALAARYLNRGEQLDDLVQVGSIGLINAIDRFDLERGVSLPTYAVPYVVGEIRRYFRDKGWAVRVPRRLQELTLRLSDLLDELSRQLGRSPTIGELAQAAETDVEEVLEALESGSAYRALSLSSGAESEEMREADRISSLGEVEGGYETIEDRAIIAEGLEALDEREQQIVHLRFYGEMTQSQIAERIGISQMHVSRLLRRALAKMHERVAQRESVGTRARRDDG